MKKILLTILTLLFTSVAYVEHRSRHKECITCSSACSMFNVAVIDNYLNHYEFLDHLSLGYVKAWRRWD